VSGFFNDDEFTAIKLLADQGTVQVWTGGHTLILICFRQQLYI